MSKFTRRLRIAILKTMEALGTSAANLAGSAKLKVQELTLENRRREILTDFSLQAFELWQKGAVLPEPLAAMLAELSDVENRLSVLRAQKFAKLNAERSAADDSAPAEPDAALPAAADDGVPTAACDAANPFSDAETAATDAPADADTAAEASPRPVGESPAE